MITVNLRRYSEPDTLREISPRTLVALMDEHREFLNVKGVALPPVGAEAELDYRALATIFLSPDDIPAELVEKFHLVKQMSGPGTMDKILDTVRARQMEFTFPADSSPEDVAAHLLLNNRALFQEIYAQKAVARKAIDLMSAAHAQGKLKIAANEISWFDNLRDTLDELPESESEFIAQQLALADKSKFLPAEYGLS